MIFMNYPLQKWLKIIGINFIAVVFIMGCFEIGFRLTGIPFKDGIPPEGHLGRFDQELGWAYLPNNFSSYQFGESNSPIALYFNRDGIRVPGSSFEFDLAKPSALFIGDSFTMGQGLFFEETFVGQFGQFKDIPLQVVNLGVQGYGTDQAFLSLKKFISKFNTKLVVYAFIHEHIERNGNYDRRMLLPYLRFPGTKPLFKLDHNGKLYLAQKPVLYKNYINSWLLDALILTVERQRWWSSPKPVDVTEAIIREMQRVSEKHGAHFVVINWYGGIEWSYDIMQELKGVDVIGSKEIMPDWWHLKIPGDGHPNQEAHGRIARMLYEYFLKNKTKILGG